MQVILLLLYFLGVLLVLGGVLLMNVSAPEWLWVLGMVVLVLGFVSSVVGSVLGHRGCRHDDR